MGAVGASLELEGHPSGSPAETGPQGPAWETSENRGSLVQIPLKGQDKTSMFQLSFGQLNT